jgi:hypothetical protein
VEAKNGVVANTVAEAMWLRQLLELHSPPCHSTMVYCDNINTAYMSNPVKHHTQRSIFTMRVALGDVLVLHVPTSSQYANVFSLH